jgi:hypothetical protein
LCVGIGAIGLPVNFLLKLFPVSEDDESDLQSEGEGMAATAGRVAEMAKSTFEA